MTTFSPRWTPGIGSTPTTSLSATATQNSKKWSRRRSPGGGTTSHSPALHLHTGCCEMSKHTLDDGGVSLQRGTAD